MRAGYIHGTDLEEQQRLTILNQITNNSFINYLDIQDNFKICDFGCGTGNIIFDLATKYRNVEITGLEKSKKYVYRAKEINKDNTGVTIFYTDIYENTLPDNFFDVTYCRYVLEHLTNPLLAVMEMVRVTKKKGRIIAQENDLYNVLFYPEIADHEYIMQKFCDLQVQMGGDPYIGRKLFDLFKKAGLKDISINIEPEIYTENNPEEYKNWMTNCLHILVGAKTLLLELVNTDEKRLLQVFGEMQDRIRKPSGVSLFYWNRITGFK